MSTRIGLPLGRNRRKKLVESKQRWAREGRLLTRAARAAAVGAPAAGSTPSPKGLAGARSRRPAGSRARALAALRVDGLVEHPSAWDWATFRAQPQTPRQPRTSTASRNGRATITPGKASRHGTSSASSGRSPRPGSWCSRATTTTPRICRSRTSTTMTVLLAHSWQGKPIPPRARRSRARGRAKALFLEEREVDPRNHFPRRRQAGFLGSARLSHARRSLDGGAIWLRATRMGSRSPRSTAARCRWQASAASRCWS